jgi:hypothetical protein
MSKLSQALELLRIEVSNSYLSRAEYRTNMELIEDAEEELADLQSLQSTVKEFIAHEDFQCRNDIYDACEEQNCPVDFIESLCSIVGYSE